MAGSCAGLSILQLFAETTSFRNDRTLAAADFQLVAIGILEEKRIVAGAVTATDFRTLERFAARLTHQLRKPIHFFARVCPECDACAVWLMIFVSRETKKF
jgi:hypothetical protein